MSKKAFGGPADQFCPGALVAGLSPPPPLMLNVPLYVEKLQRQPWAQVLFEHWGVSVD